MKLYPTLYPGDSILQPATDASSDTKTAWNRASFGAPFVRSSMTANSAPELRIDLVTMERQARAARSAWIGSKLKSYYQALVHKFARGGQAARKDYLAASQCLADLEKRIRREERMQSQAILTKPVGF